MGKYTTCTHAAFLCLFNYKHHLPMCENYTENHLLQLLYTENQTTETEQISDMLQSMPALAGTFSQWKETLHSLDEVNLNPHPTSVSLIMEYAAKLHETV